MKTNVDAMWSLKHRYLTDNPWFQGTGSILEYNGMQVTEHLVHKIVPAISFSYDPFIQIFTWEKISLQWDLKIKIPDR